ncbi:MAG: ATP-dependent DNA helicase RecG [Gammaproteobacteria bacterium]|nr:ATP-dependent DNA helicase RecG [Gammaproteobacteria bacterium]
MPTLNSPCTVLKGVGDRVAERLAHLGLNTLHNLLFHLPLRYEDRTHIVPIARLTIGHSSLIEGQVTKVQMRYGGKRSVIVTLEDDTGSVELRFYHFSAPQLRQLQIPNIRLRCFGELRWLGNQRGIVHPEYQIISTSESFTASEHLTAVYPTAEGLSQTVLRKLVKQTFTILESSENSLQEFLPLALLQQWEYPSLKEALKALHFPSSQLDSTVISASKYPPRRRLVLEELLAHQLSLQQIKYKIQHESAHPLPQKNQLVEQFLAKLPFKLTGAQQRVVSEVSADLSKPLPMLRLIQGDVGSGKTVVAAVALLQAVAAGYQAALMAPTELLAEQHYRNLLSWLNPLGIKIAWHSGSRKTSEKQEALNTISDGTAQIIVGTHALFQKDVHFSSLALIVVDEQHRFGVHQRLALRKKGSFADHCPHQLVMTATPIPRTLAMTAYADLDYSIIDELPPGRTPVTTVNIPNSRREEVIERIRANCSEGKQAYWVCTLIEESDVLQCQAAEEVCTHLRSAIPELKIGLVHGRLKQSEKEAVMHSFKTGEYSLLVATTVIEVGVDVPNASLMIIENPERLGLAQLHQLRGRVGRGQAVSYCVLLYQQPLSEHAQERLTIMRQTNDGFLIAQKDLELRGPGEVLGTRQTGLLQLKIADLIRDADLLPQVRELANKILAEAPNTVEPLIKRWISTQQNYLNV